MAAPDHRDAIRTAHARVRSHVRETPVMTEDARDFGLAIGPLLLKLEFLQHAGSFKTRGAFNSLLSQTMPESGVVAASGGNHGAAVAFAAQRLGIKAKIFVPSIASPAKIEQIRGYGADLVIGGDRYADALAASEAWIKTTGALPIHAYDQIATIVGQGTLALEFERQAAGAMPFDTLLVGVGGGGLIAGLASWFRGRVKLVAVEPRLAPTLHNARAHGAPIDSPAGGYAADSLAPRQIGALTFPIAQAFVAESVLVEDASIHAAQATLWRTLRIVAEPGGAAAFAALASGAYQPALGEKVAVLLCGANTTAVTFPPRPA